MIEILRQRLETLEDRGTFGGKAYPDGIVPFPRTLIGQGFFPGGDGLWRDATPAIRLKEPSPYPFPCSGIMFLGNDFGSLAGFEKLKLHENPPTWRHLRRRIALAGIPGELGFFTNAYLGLRSDRNALEHPVSNPRYRDLCAEFLDFQLECQSPKLIVVLGDRPGGLLEHVLGNVSASLNQLKYASRSGSHIGILKVSHPYSDLNKTAESITREAETLRAAWQRIIRDNR
jgi:uracil-DNA glycosylase